MSAQFIFFVFATMTSAVAAVWILGALFTDKLQSMPKWHMAGLLVGAIGLMAQTVRNVWFLTTGESMSDSDLPLWYLKDLGYFLIAMHSIILVATGKLQLNKPKAKPRTRKAAAKR